MQNRRIFLCGLGVMILGGVFFAQTAQSKETPLSEAVQGRWDLEMNFQGGRYPSWLEIKRSGHSTLVGQFVGTGDSVRPISKVEVKDGQIEFTIPPQWEWKTPTPDIHFKAKLEGDKLRGTMTNQKGALMNWEGVRAPLLKRTGKLEWGNPIVLFNGKSLDGWKIQGGKGTGGWQLKDGLLSNEKPGDNLMTTRKFTDFRMHAEFKYPSGSNSGIYLRGRYEMQIEDNYGMEPESHYLGGIYGFLTPSVNAAKRAGEWQSVDITFVGRHVSITMNGAKIIENQEIPGITGGAIDSKEGEPGPIMFQGDHGKVQFRNVVITPAK